MSNASPRRTWGTWIPCGVAALLWLVFLPLSFWIAVSLMVDYDGVLRAYPSPERSRGVSELELPSAAESLVRRGEGDFDGDGVSDELSVEYFRMAPLFRRATTGMVYVRSGRTGEVLLAHAVSTPLNPAVWVGDLDGNGTDDIVVHDHDGDRRWRVALGYRGRSR